MKTYLKQESKAYQTLNNSQLKSDLQVLSDFLRLRNNITSTRTEHVENYMSSSSHDHEVVIALEICLH